MSEEITVEQALEVLQARTQANMRQCEQLVQAALDRFSAKIIVVQSITPDGRIVGRIAIAPRGEA